ncbi:MAG: CC0125/CC1285 family lipoprotein [Thermodesulfobacteriota bacterium]
MKGSCKVFTLLPIVPLLVAGCVGVTPYQEADSKGYGVKTYRMSDNRYKVIVKASPVTDKGTAEGYFWRRAQDLCGCPGAVHGDLISSDPIEGCLRVSHTIRAEGHRGKVTTQRRGGALSETYETTEAHEENTEVSGEVECLKESK